MAEEATETAGCPDLRCPNEDLEYVGDEEPDHDYYCYMCRVMYPAEEVVPDA